jgi:hypothetical protein
VKLKESTRLKRKVVVLVGLIRLAKGLKYKTDKLKEDLKLTRDELMTANLMEILDSQEKEN